MNDTEMVIECFNVINKYSGGTQKDYQLSDGAFGVLYRSAENTFQEMCVVAAYSKMWDKGNLTLINIFE